MALCCFDDVDVSVDAVPEAFPADRVTLESQTYIEARHLLSRLTDGKVKVAGRRSKGVPMRNWVVGAALICAGMLGAEESGLLKVGDTLPPCFPQHLAGPDKSTDTCPV
jgi:hypothetical protein